MRLLLGLLLAVDPDALLRAAYEGDLAAVERLLRSGAHVNAANDLGATPLWTACQHGNASIVRRLLAAGANPNAALLGGETPLMAAARGGYAEVVSELLSQQANPNARGPRGQTALMWAAARKHSRVVQVLLDHRADVHPRSDTWTDTMAVPPHGYLPYNKAIPHGNDTALLFAARSGDFASARLLLAAGANANDQDAWGVSATTLAAHSGFNDLVELLLANGADPNAMDAGFSALHIAVVRRDERMAAALLARGADPNAPLKTWTPTRRSSKDYYFDPALVGATPYWLAARYLHPGLMRLLAKHGANPKTPHRSTRVREIHLPVEEHVSTPLMAALGMGGSAPEWVETPRQQRAALASECVRIALEHGIDPAFADTDGKRAIDAAGKLGYKDVIALLTARETP